MKCTTRTQDFTRTTKCWITTYTMVEEMFPIERWAACPPQGAGRSSIKARQNSEELSDMGTYKCFTMRGFRNSEGNLGF
jgi:hypothetical protein